MLRLSIANLELMILILGRLHYPFLMILLTLGRFYNKTPYSGLETHISNSYANALLQLMRFTTLIRNLALQHTATSCVNDVCLLCEMGFLFDMLEKAAGTVCQATNLLKTFGHFPEGKYPLSPPRECFLQC